VPFVGTAVRLEHANCERARERSQVRGGITSCAQQLENRGPDERARVINLSGGNQQKVLISRALDVNPKARIVDEPTRGVDVGAKALIHARLRELAQSGIAVIVISSEMPEVIGLSDRILVFRNGGVSAELENYEGEVTQETIMSTAVYH
jgi:ABC-type sugar transport system ATPase subunit